MMRKNDLTHGVWTMAAGLAAATATVLLATPAHAVVGISGTMSNFDVFNETTTDAYGAEIELEGCHAVDVMSTYPAHFNSNAINEYSTGATFGTRITFTGYNFLPAEYIAPTVGQNTNGHFAVDIPGAEHFGFSVGQQPSVTRFYWLDQGGQRIGTMPLAIPNPTWTYVPPAKAGDQPVVLAVVQIPEPAEAHVQQADAIWMKVFETELDRPVSLEELISGGDVAPQEAAEVEIEWELLEDGVLSEAEAPVGKDAECVIRRYEFFAYTGPYSSEHEALSTYNGVGDPPDSELGQFIAANMVAANLVPEPTVGALVAATLVAAAVRRRTR
jgi:hypothetical protein